MFEWLKPASLVPVKKTLDEIFIDSFKEDGRWVSVDTKRWKDIKTEVIITADKHNRLWIDGVQLCWDTQMVFWQIQWQRSEAARMDAETELREKLEKLYANNP